MKCALFGVILVLVVASGGLGAVPGLTDAQRTALSDVSEGGEVLDEAGLYALLKNVAAWEGDATAGARIPDFEALRDQPGAYRGERFVVRGQLHARVDFQSRPQTISRPGWSKVGLWQLQARPSEEGAALGVLVYLMESPVPEDELQWFEGETVRYGVPVERDRPVEIVGRFYKHVRLPGRTGEPMSYPVFVGHSARFVDRGEASAESGGASTVAPVAVIVALLILFGGAYALFRFGLLKRRDPVRPSERWRAIREAETGGGSAEADETMEELDLRDDLPEDPAEAMALLEDEHRNAETVVIDSPTNHSPDPHRGSSHSASSQSRTRS